MRNETNTTQDEWPLAVYDRCEANYAVVPGIAEQLALAHGWRDAYLALGAVVVAVMLPLGLIFFRNRPQTYGLLADFGRSATPKARRTAAPPAAPAAAATAPTTATKTSSPTPPST